MSGSRWTPGPWRVKRWTTSGDVDVLCDGSRVCSVDRWADPSDTNANAHLLAAAPELYEALRGLLVLADEWAAYDAEKAPIEKARAALKKAEAARAEHQAGPPKENP